MTENAVISQTINWIKSVVIGCNFCPFAANALLRNSVRYVVLPNCTVENSLGIFIKELIHLDHSTDIETTFLIFPNNFAEFEPYLDLVELAETLASDQGYDGVYQVASFHPAYCFAGADDSDPANYTNRSIYPMLHILREDSITKALEHFKNPEEIPQRNIHFAQQKGLEYMRALFDSCLKSQ